MKMKIMSKKLAPAFCTIFVGMMLITTANAECGKSTAPHGSLKPQSWQREDGSASSTLLRVDDFRDPIVGMWKVTFTGQGNGSSGPPDGTVIDSAIVVWHSDGTEIMNSGRPPQDGNFCMGVWENRGRFGYKLNHFAMGNDTANSPGGIGNPFGVSQFHQTVFLNAKADSYSGPFTIDVYDASGAPVLHIAGMVSATRITVNTPASVFF